MQPVATASHPPPAARAPLNQVSNETNTRKSKRTNDVAVVKNRTHSGSHRWTGAFEGACTVFPGAGGYALGLNLISLVLAVLPGRPKGPHRATSRPRPARRHTSRSIRSFRPCLAYHSGLPRPQGPPTSSFGSQKPVRSNICVGRRKMARLVADFEHRKRTSECAVRGAPGLKAPRPPILREWPGNSPSSSSGDR
jgi:hypothetical protein